MSKAAIVVLTGLALFGPALAGAEAGTPAYAQDTYEPAGDEIPTIEFDTDEYEDLEEIQGRLGEAAQPADAGRYRLTLPPSGDRGQLATIRKDPSTSLWVTLTARMPTDREYSDDIRLVVGTESGTECASTDVSVSESDEFYAGPVPIGVLVDPSTVSGSSTLSECMSAETLSVMVAHEPDEELPVPAELTVIEEPSVVGTEQLPEEADTEDLEPSWSAGPKAEHVRGAASFQQAPVLRSGRYADRVQVGGARLYRIDAGWGRRIEATMNVSRPSAGEAAQLDGEVAMVLFGPNRQPVGGSQESVSAESDTVLGVRSPTVRYRNRESSELGGSALAGPYYVLVSTPASPQNPDVSLSYELDLQIDGNPSGAPRYSGPGAPDGPLVTDTVRQDRSDRSDAEGGGGEAAPSERTGPWPTLGPVLVGLAAAALVLLVGLTQRWRRGRRAS